MLDDIHRADDAHQDPILIDDKEPMRYRHVSSTALPLGVQRTVSWWTSYPQVSIQIPTVSSLKARLTGTPSRSALATAICIWSRRAIAARMSMLDTMPIGRRDAL